MAPSTPKPVSRSLSLSPRAALLAGASATALILAAGPWAHAASLTATLSTGSTSATTIATDAATRAAQQAQQAAQQANESLSRATQAIQAMQATQAAARAAAQARGTSVTSPLAIPNGLGAGGLAPNLPAGWSGANQPSQSVDATGRTSVVVNQTTSSAILNWTTFNVGANTTLTFNQQGNATWVVLNRVSAATGPSQILGNVKADGTVYVINQSGIIFGGGSQINVGSLIASTAGITDAQFQAAGIFSTQTAGAFNPSFTGAGEGAAGGLGGRIVVEQGAVIATNGPGTVTEAGGYVLLMGTAVDNAGSISTPMGQTLFAAGHDFILQPGASTSNLAPTTLGREVAPGTETSTGWVSGGGTVDNTGLVFSQQGDITLAGHSVIQDGVLLSTTSVDQRGTIHLLNSGSDTTGSVTLTGNAVTLVAPELDSSATAINAARDTLIAASTGGLVGFATGQFDNLATGADRKDQSRIEIVTGGTAEFQGSSLTQAQGGQVVVDARTRIQVDPNAVIDVSGVQGVALPMSANEIEISVEPNDLRDAPVNRDTGVLSSQNVFVDVRDLIVVPAGTGGDTSERLYTSGGLLEVSSFVNNAPHTIGEWTAIGGTITLSSAAVVAPPGAVFNISGGSVQYQSGVLQETEVLGSDGRLYNINDVPAGVAITGFADGFVVDHPHWGVTETYRNPLIAAQVFEPGYTVGRDAGSLVLTTPTAIFAGDIVDGITVGASQIQARPAGVTDGYQLGQDTVPLQGTLTISNGAITSVTAVTIGVSDPLASLPLTAAIPASRRNTVSLDAAQIDGLGGLTVNASGAGSITVNAPLALAPGGQINFSAPIVAVNAGITVPAGAVTMTATGGTTIASIAVAPGIAIDTSGSWSNAALDPSNLSGLAFLNGGAVSLISSGNLVLGSGSLIDASSGGAVLANGKTQGGAGGDISVAANSHGGSSNAMPFGSEGLVLDGTLRSQGVTRGGALTVSNAGLIAIGDTPVLPNGTLPAGVAAPTTLTLATKLVLQAGSALPFTVNLSTTVVGPGQSFLLAAQPTVSSTNTVTTAAPWTVGTGFGQVVARSNGVALIFSVGQTVPAGAVISLITGTGGGPVPVGTMVPADVFPSGIPVPAYVRAVPAGTVLTSTLMLPVGTLIPQGTVLAQDVPVLVLNLAPSFFQQGFSAYAITAQNLQVAPDTNLDVVMPVLQFNAASLAAPTGSNPQAALTLALPALYQGHPGTDTVTQRAGASLSLSALLSSGDAFAALNLGISGEEIAPLTIGKKANVTVDPGQAVSINGWGETAIEGAIRAPGGTIAILSTRPFELEDTPVGGTADPALSIWIGGGAALDVAAQPVTFLDRFGRAYGVIPNGGTITIDGTGSDASAATEGILPSTEAFVIIRPGAVLDASGASAPIDFAAGTGALPLSIAAPAMPASSGGSISLSSYSGLFIEGTLRASAGGAGAAGGTLSLTLESPIYSNSLSLPHPFTVTNGARHLRILTVDTTLQPSGLSATLAPGAADPALLVGTAHIGVDQIADGGFANLSLYGGDAIAFNGSVNLSLVQSLALKQGALSLTAATPNAQVSLSAPYVLLDGSVGHVAEVGETAFSSGGPATQLTTTGTLLVTADQIDLQNGVRFGQNRSINEVSGSIPSTVPVTLPAFAAISLISQGDIRFLAGTVLAGAPATENAVGRTSFVTIGNLNLTAARIYPGTDVTADVVAGFSPQANGTLTIANVGATPDTRVPDTVFGSLLLAAPDIEQGGVVAAPLGALEIGGSSVVFSAFGATGGNTTTVNFLPGSLTSVSANSLTIPYGGTSDGIHYIFDGTAVVFVDPFNEAGQFQSTNQVGVVGSVIPGAVLHGLQINSQAIKVQSNASLDLDGGGNLTGAGFIQGEGGSVDVLRTPLVSANPTNTGASSDKVFAIVPSFQDGYAPVSPDAGAGNPGVGQQVTLGAGVPGLPAGTYTLLPSTYALLPGAFRVEIGGTATNVPGGALSNSNGSFEVAGNLGTAHTTIRDVIPSELIVTPANTVANYSQYNLTSYSQFAEQQAGLFGTALPSLPMDAKLLVLNFTSIGTAPPLTMNGILNQTPGRADGFTGSAGTLIVTTGSALLANGRPIDILGPGQPSSPGSLSLLASDLDAFHAGALVIGGYFIEPLSLGQPIAVNTTTPTNVVMFEATSGAVTVTPGAVLTAPQVFLLGNQSVTIDAGATVSTIGTGRAPWESSTSGVVVEVEGVGLSNGDMVVLPFTPALTNAISVQNGATLLAGGTIGFGAGSGLTLGSSVTLGAQALVVTAPSVNIGTSDTLATAQATGVLPAGWSLSQDTLGAIMAGNNAAGVPRLLTLTLTVNNSINFFGTVDVSTIDPASGRSDLDLVLNTPSIYGFGSSSDVARLTTGTLTWNGITTGSASNLASATPMLPIPNGPGTGSGTFEVVAGQIVFGYGPNTMPQDQVTLNRQMLGFGTVNLNASGSITANNNGTLAVYQSETLGGATPVFSGGNLHLVTPLVTGEAGSVMGYTAGGALTVAAPAGGATASTTAISALGAEVDLTAASVTINTAVALPTGKLAVNATGNIALGANAQIDLSGRAVTMFDLTEFSWGGDVILWSAQGSITQTAGSTIDVSAVNNSAGSITAQAVATGAGQVALDGTLRGASTLMPGAPGLSLGGIITVGAQTLASGSGANLTDDFAGLNAALDAGGFTGARHFDLKQGDLTIAAGQTIRAQTVDISVDSGSLTVNGTIDASGAAPGTIALAAMHSLTLAGSSLLDAHGTTPQLDGFGNFIDAENRAHVSLTATTGMLTLEAGARINAGSPDPIPQGDIEISVPRTGETSGNANIRADGPLTITGAGTIAVNAFWHYAPTDANGTIVQDNGDAGGNPVAAGGAGAGLVGINQIDARSQQFINAALINSAFLSGIEGLTGAVITASSASVVAPVDPDGTIASTQTFATQTGLGLAAGQSVAVIDSANSAIGINGTVASYDKASGTLKVNVASVSGGPVTGSIATWAISAAPNMPTAFHLRPGVEIDSSTKSNGDLTVPGDLDLSGSRYFSLNPATVRTAAVYGSGEPGVLTTRAANNLNVFGSINDGFAPPLSTPDDIGWLLVPGPQLTTVQTQLPIVLIGGTSGTVTTFPNTAVALGYAIPIRAATIAANTRIPVQVTLASAFTVPPGTELAAAVLSSTGAVLFPAGTIFSTATSLPAGTQVAAGTVLPANVNITAMTWPAGANLNVFTQNVSLSQNVTVQSGQVIPAGTSVALTVGTIGTLTSPLTLSAPTVLTATTTFPATADLSFLITVGQASIKRGVTIPFQFTSQTQVDIPTAWTTTAPIFDADGNLLVAAGATVSAGTPLQAGDVFGAGSLIPVQGGTTTLPIAAGASVPAGTPLSVFNGSVSLNTPITLPAGTVLPVGANIQNLAGAPTRPTTGNGSQGQMWAVAPLLPAGDLSWSMNIVAGADSGAAAVAQLRPAGVLAGGGNLTLDDTHLDMLGTGNMSVAPSVVRTGTGSLQVLAGGSFSQGSLYGIYTAGTPSADVSAGFQTPRSILPDGTVLGAGFSGYNAVAADYQAYYPTNGGDLTLVAQGDVTSVFVQPRAGTNTISNNIGNWLWEQGGAGLGQQGAWWINFGTYALQRGPSGALDFSIGPTVPTLAAFEGVGTLGGGNLTVVAGGDAGTVAPTFLNTATTVLNGTELGGTTTTALDLTVAATGRVRADGTLVETGGGKLTLAVGGKLNPVTTPQVTGGGIVSNQGFGVFTDVRGDALVRAGSIGRVTLQYLQANADNPVPADPLDPIRAAATGGPVLAPGDSTMTIETRGDISLGSAADPGRQIPVNATLANAGGRAGDAISWFTLQTANSGITLVSAGGNVSPQDVVNGNGNGVDALSAYPPSLRVAALGGSIYDGSGSTQVELAPSPIGQIEMLAENSIFGGGWVMSGAAPSTEATAFDPGYLLFTQSLQIEGVFFPVNGLLSTNSVLPSPIIATTTAVTFADRSLFNFGIDTVTSTIHANDSQPARFYAVNGNIEELDFGSASTSSAGITTFQGAKAVDIRAGQNIIDLGVPFVLPVGSSATPGSTIFDEMFILNVNPTDVSVISAGAGIYFANAVVAGPGTLEVMAGRDIYQGDHGLIESIGPVVNAASNPNSGANVIAMPGVGTFGPNWSGFANLYFNPANQGDPELTAGAVAQTYQDQLFAYLQQNFGYTGTRANALGFFLSLPVPQQSVFDLQVYFSELNSSGLEFNQPSSMRFQSYVRGKEAIATLFPGLGANGEPIRYQGSLTMESGAEAFFFQGRNAGLYDSGIHTEFGGNVQIVAPGGAVTVGANAITPGPATGILTEGSGDVDIYALDSVELGLSRIFTTFGGNILVWSAEGDINAGKGAKSSVVFAPKRIAYDDFGHISLSPTVPTTGAGIATLNPIPEVPPGNINLVAPLGIIDAGEAGIRVSGNVNLAALQVVNAANIQVQGTAVGIPTTPAPPVGALTSASNSAAATQQVAPPPPGNNSGQASVVIVEVVGYGGGGDRPTPGEPDARKRQDSPDDRSQNPASPVQVIGAGPLDHAAVEQLTEDERKRLVQ